MCVSAMVICVSNQPYWMVFGGPLGVLGDPCGSFGGPGGPVGSREVRGRLGKGWGGLREDPGGSRGGLKNVFLVVRSEIVNGLMKY